MELTSSPFVFHCNNQPEKSTFVVVIIAIINLMFASVSSTPVHFEITQSPVTLNEIVKSYPEVTFKDQENTITFPETNERKCILNINECSVPETSDPMCGTDGITYKNLDELNCYRSKCQPGLSIKSVGECSSVAKSKEAQRLQRVSKPHGSLALPKVDKTSSSKAVTTCVPDECGCSNEFHPICGADGITYGNECLMECNKKCSPGATKFHDGYCGKLFFRDRFSNTYQDFRSDYRPLVFVQSNTNQV